MKFYKSISWEMRNDPGNWQLLIRVVKVPAVKSIGRVLFVVFIMQLCFSDVTVLNLLKVQYS